MTKKKSLLGNLFDFAGNYKYYTILGMVLSGISAILTLLPIIFIWLGVKEIFEMHPNIIFTESLSRYAYAAVATSILAMLLYFVSLMLTHKAAFRIAKNMRMSAITHLMKLPLGFFSQSGSGRLNRIITDSATLTEGYLAHQLPDLVSAFTTPIAVLIILFVFDWRLGFISIIPIILGIFVMSFVQSKDNKKLYADNESGLERMSNEAVEYVRGMAVVKTFGQSIFSFKRFHDTIIDYKIIVLKITDAIGTSMILYQSLLASTAMFLTLGGIFIFTGVSDAKTYLLQFVFYIFFTPICGVMFSKIMYLSQNTVLAQDAYNRITDLMSIKPLEIKQTTTSLEKFDILFENVSYSYPNSENKAVNDVSLCVKEGETVAFVGESGGGKTTLAMLIARFFDATEGSVKIGGVNVKDTSEHDLMNNISFVFQNTNLYKMSIADNLREGKPDASESELLEALKNARCMDIIAKLPNGMDTIIGTKGVYLSGGEAQRISIARALLKNAPIVLLDEATSFTDPENEYEIKQAFNTLVKGKTVIMIAHRLSTVQDVDKIYVIEKGKIKECGSHAELVSQNGEYRSMWQEYKKVFAWNESGVNES